MNALGPTREPNLNACTIISSSWTSGVRDAVSNLKNDGEGRYRYTSRDRDFATEIPNRSLTTLRGLTCSRCAVLSFVPGRGQAETGSIRVHLHIRGRGAQFAAAGARLFLQGPLCRPL